MNKNYLNQHSRPVTRREFVARGLAAAGGFAMMPTVLSLLMKSPESQAGGTAVAPRFITFDLNGGAALFANFLVGGTGGAKDLLPKYDLLGWDPRAAGALDSRFGLPMAANGVSQILAGLLATASAEAQANLRFGSLLHIGQIDSTDNPLSILSLVDSSQLSAGGKLPGALGLYQTPSGANSKPLVDLPANRPYFVKDLPTLLSALGLGGAFALAGDTDKGRIAKLMQRLSTTQLNALLGGPLSQQGFDFLSGSVNQAERNVLLGGGLDPRQNADFQQIYGIASDSDVTSTAVLRAALVMNTLNGTTGPSVIEIDQCDYHDQSQTTGDAKDLEIGQEIGRVVEAAKRLKVPVFIHIITDGGIYPKQGTRIWEGDDVETSMTVLGYYSPAGAPQYRVSERCQIGAYTANQGADRSTLFGANPALAANAALANYLSVCGRMDLLPAIYPSSLSAALLEPTLIFG